jgi:hypothetical protein
MIYFMPYCTYDHMLASSCRVNRGQQENLCFHSTFKIRGFKQTLFIISQCPMYPSEEIQLETQRYYVTLGRSRTPLSILVKDL